MVLIWDWIRNWFHWWEHQPSYSQSPPSISDGTPRHGVSPDAGVRKKVSPHSMLMAGPTPWSVLTFRCPGVICLPFTLTMWGNIGIMAGHMHTPVCLHKQISQLSQYSRRYLWRKKKYGGLRDFSILVIYHCYGEEQFQMNYVVSILDSNVYVKGSWTWIFCN